MLSSAVIAKTSSSVYSPTKGVICDKYICADKKGVSKKLTAKYLGTYKANKAFSQGDFDTSRLRSQTVCSVILKQNYAMSIDTLRMGIAVKLIEL